MNTVISKTIKAALRSLLLPGLLFSVMALSLLGSNSEGAMPHYFTTTKRELVNPTEAQFEAAGFGWKTYSILQTTNNYDGSTSVTLYINNSQTATTKGGTKTVTVPYVKSTGATIIFYALKSSSGGAKATITYRTASSSNPTMSSFDVGGWSSNNITFYAPSSVSDLFISNGYIATNFTDYYGSAGTATYYLGLTGAGTSVPSDAPKAKTVLTKPTAGTNTFTYTGSLITYSPSGYDSSTMSLTNFYAKAPGSYTATVGIKDTTNYMWTDGTTDSFTLSFKINAITLAALSNGTNSFTYDGTSKTYSPSGFDSNHENISGNVNTEPGTYTATVSLRDSTGYRFSDGSTGNKTFSYTINKIKTAAVSASTSTFDYDGQLKTLTINGYDSAHETLSGNTATEPGTYTATLSLKDSSHYTFSDGTTANKTFTYTIRPILVGALSAGTTSFTYTGKTITYTPSGYDSAHETISDASATNPGSHTAVVKLSDSTHYNFQGYSTTDQSFNWQIVKASPSVSVSPTASDITYGDTLSLSSLSGGTMTNPVTGDTVSGTWSWKDGTQTPHASSSTTFTAVFTPEDTTGYNTVEVSIGVVVNPQPRVISTDLRLVSKSDDSVMLNAVTDGEYAVSKDGGATWSSYQSSNVFSGLSEHTAYQFRYRLVGSGDYTYSEPSNVVDVTTKYTGKAPTSASVDYTRMILTGLEPNVIYNVDGADLKSDTSGEIKLPSTLIDGDLLSKDFVIYRSATDTTAKSSDVVISREENGTAPAGISFNVEPTSEGKVTVEGISTDMEYEINGTWYPVTGTTMDVDPSTPLSFRFAVTSSTPKSKEYAVTAPSILATPESQVAYVDGQLTGLTPDSDYSIDGTTYHSDASGKIAVVETWKGQSVSIVALGDATKTVNSFAQSVTLNKFKSVPSLKTTYVDDVEFTLASESGVEYSLDGVSWQDSPDFTSLTGGTTYSVKARYKTTDSSFASDIATLDVALPTKDGLIDARIKADLAELEDLCKDEGDPSAKLTALLKEAKDAVNNVDRTGAGKDVCTEADKITEGYKVKLTQQIHDDAIDRINKKATSDVKDEYTKTSSPDSDESAKILNKATEDIAAVDKSLSVTDYETKVKQIVTECQDHLSYQKHKEDVTKALEDLKGTTGGDPDSDEVIDTAKSELATYTYGVAHQTEPDMDTLYTNTVKSVALILAKKSAVSNLTNKGKDATSSSAMDEGDKYSVDDLVASYTDKINNATSEEEVAALSQEATSAINDIVGQPQCFYHWISLAFLLLDMAVGVCFYLQNKKRRLLGLALACHGVYAIALFVLAFFARCSLCYVVLLLSVAVLAMEGVYLLRAERKAEKE
jgi:hypothetical protein